MRVCDRCGSAKGVGVCRLFFQADGFNTRGGPPTDLCAECQEVMRQLVHVAGLKAPDVLRVLDGEPPADVVKAAGAEAEAREEIPFDAAAVKRAKVLADRYAVGLQNSGRYTGAEMDRMRAAYEAATLKRWPEHLCRVAAAVVLPKGTFNDRMRRMLAALDGADAPKESQP